MQARRKSHDRHDRRCATGGGACLLPHRPIVILSIKLRLRVSVRGSRAGPAGLLSLTTSLLFALLDLVAGLPQIFRPFKRQPGQCSELGINL